MSDSHFNPRFSPIAGHWRLLRRNLDEHLRRQWPRLEGGGVPDPRLGLGTADQARLLHALDFWWLYLVYAGFPPRPALLVAGALVLLAAVALGRALALAAAEARAESPATA
jgi:hypothetical protein